MKKEFTTLSEELIRIKELSGVKINEGIFSGKKKIGVASPDGLLIGEVYSTNKYDTGVSITTSKFDLYVDYVEKTGKIVYNDQIYDLPEIELNDVIGQIKKQGLD